MTGTKICSSCHEATGRQLFMAPNSGLVPRREEASRPGFNLAGGDVQAPQPGHDSQWPFRKRQQQRWQQRALLTLRGDFGSPLCSYVSHLGVKLNESVSGLSGQSRLSLSKTKVTVDAGVIFEFIDFPKRGNLLFVNDHSVGLNCTYKWGD